MPYKDPRLQREYVRIWIAKRRAEYLKDKICEACGSQSNLQLDHDNNKTKISHRIWSWSKERRIEELKKCSILCEDCHKNKTYENEEYIKGTDHYRAKLTEQQVVNIRIRYKVENLSMRKLAFEYKVDVNTIWKIIRRKSWTHI